MELRLKGIQIQVIINYYISIIAYRSYFVVQKRRAVRAAALVRKECAGHPHSTR
jgi:hypothetical protein